MAGREEEQRRGDMGQDIWRGMEKVTAGWDQGQPKTRRRQWKKDGDEGIFMSEEELRDWVHNFQQG